MTDQPRWMGLAEVARHLGVDARRAARITRRRGFPVPCAVLTVGRVWRTADVEQWIADQPDGARRPSTVRRRSSENARRPLDDAS